MMQVEWNLATHTFQDYLIMNKNTKASISYKNLGGIRIRCLCLILFVRNKGHLQKKFKWVELQKLVNIKDDNVTFSVSLLELAAQLSA